MIFGRVKSLDSILATAERKSLHRSLGARYSALAGDPAARLSDEEQESEHGQGLVRFG